jgi:hypothetical protein
MLDELTHAHDGRVLRLHSRPWCLHASIRRTADDHRHVHLERPASDGASWREDLRPLFSFDLRMLGAPLRVWRDRALKILPLLLLTLLAAAIATAGPATADIALFHADIAFPEYHAGAACLRRPPDHRTHTLCLAEERDIRLKLLSQWQIVEQNNAVAAEACIDILKHPDAGPPSYTKLSDCIAGTLYAGE